MKTKPLIPVSISIDRISSKGFGVGLAKKTETSPETKSMVPGAIPGDLVVAEIGPKKKGAYLGKLLTIVQASDDRREAPCPHVPACGGCSLQAMKYEKQLAQKQSIVEGLFHPLSSCKVEPILPSPLEWRYRNKMEYTFSQNKAGEKFLGLIQVGSKGKVEPLKECYLSPSWFIPALHAVKAWWDASELTAFHGIRGTGSLRNVTLREGSKTGQKMVLLTVSGDPEYALSKKHLSNFASCIQSVLPGEDVSIFLRVQQAIRGQATQFFEMNLAGPDHIVEEMDIACFDFQRRYRFKISPTAFFQPNTLQAEKLYSKALEIAGGKKRKKVLDLYAGTATLGLLFAAFAEEVISIELNPYATFDGEVNRELNEVNNIKIYKGDVAEVLKDLKKKGALSERPDLVVVDPPRTGLSPEAAQEILALKPFEVLYISCAPKEQARDAALFQAAGYEIIAVQPVDQFPHTVHIENIVLLRRA